MAKRIMLTMADELYKALENKRKAFGYMTTQEVINDILRKSLFQKPPLGKVGRPKKSADPYLDYFSREKK